MTEGHSESLHGWLAWKAYGCAVHAELNKSLVSFDLRYNNSVCMFLQSCEKVVVKVPDSTFIGRSWGPNFKLFTE